MSFASLWEHQEGSGVQTVLSPWNRANLTR